MFDEFKCLKEPCRVHDDELHVLNLNAKIGTAMPPGPVYNWLCVLHSATEILSLAARHKVTQIVPRSTSSPLNSRKRRRTEETVDDILVSVDHASSALAEKSSGHEPIVNASSITVDIQSEVLILFK